MDRFSTATYLSSSQIEEFQPTEFQPTEFQPTEFQPTEFQPTLSQLVGSEPLMSIWLTISPMLALSVVVPFTAA